ncbi:MaoC/PaaZ C-terminal domain-containing protein [Xanthobacter autotrophicus DSM 431]|uniref:MaoC/PaaZ C-terminal domain-containing protein n=1 Tax=Xanthobacter nonsaccharivorans TaxID=3119912 RepID=UPI00372894BB
MARTFPPLEFSYGSREAIIYALCAGMGQDPLDRRELDFVYEPRLKLLPTLLTAAAWDYRFIEGSGIDEVMILHGAQRVTVHAPLPPAATVVNRFRIADIFDKGPGRGAVVVAETELREKASGRLLCTHLWTSYARGEGGFGGPRGLSEPPVTVPHREPDAVVAAATTTSSSTLYRLLGDVNPLHVDPDVAIAAGFPRPILHGLCTYAIVSRAIVAAACGYAPERLAMLDCRFLAPAFPGDSIDTEMWVDTGTATFRATARERGVELARGTARLADSAPPPAVSAAAMTPA